MALARARLSASALAVVGNFIIAAGSLAAPQQIAELSLQGLASHPKWIPEEQPLFGSYIGSGDGEASGALGGHVFWDLYEEQSRDDRHPTFFRGFVERDGRRYPFEIIGIYTPESADSQLWRISGVINFADRLVLGTAHETLTGTWDASTRMSHFTIWTDRGAR
jgi:hypothetical protein